MWFLQRFKEPSTWAGISMMAAAFGVPVAILPIIAKAGALAAAVAAVVLPEASV